MTDTDDQLTIRGAALALTGIVAFVAVQFLIWLAGFDLPMPPFADVLFERVADYLGTGRADG